MLNGKNANNKLINLRVRCDENRKVSKYPVKRLLATFPAAPIKIGKYMIKICPICKKEFKVIPAQIRTNRGKYCSKICCDKSKIGKKLDKSTILKMRQVALRGSNNPNWRGGISSLRLKVYASYKYKEWRQQIFIRDNFTCQKCGDNSGGNLNAHHIKPFWKLLNEATSYLPLFDKLEAVLLYTPMWNINNGITYCKKCHKNIKYGKGVKHPKALK